MNRFFAFAIIASVFTVACSDDATPTSPSDETTTYTYTAALLPANEVPPVNNADSVSRGTATITLRVNGDPGRITQATMDLQVNVNGLPAGTTVTKAHIHSASAGANGGIFVDSNLGSGELGLTGGTGSIGKNGISVPADTATAIINNPAAHYFNVHTALNPDGAMRGQLTR